MTAMSIGHVEPDWHRRLRVRLKELFSGSSPEARDAYRAAITLLVTLSSSSIDLNEAERMAFEATLNEIEHGETLIRRRDGGGVEIYQAGWRYRMGFDPLEVTAVPEQ
jgi:hypothetical protein